MTKLQEEDSKLVSELQKLSKQLEEKNEHKNCSLIDIAIQRVNRLQFSKTKRTKEECEGEIEFILDNAMRIAASLSSWMRHDVSYVRSVVNKAFQDCQKDFTRQIMYIFSEMQSIEDKECQKE